MNKILGKFRIRIFWIVMLALAIVLILTRFGVSFGSFIVLVAFLFSASATLYRYKYSSDFESGVGIVSPEVFTQQGIDIWWEKYGQLCRERYTDLSADPTKRENLAKIMALGVMFPKLSVMIKTLEEYGMDPKTHGIG